MFNLNAVYRRPADWAIIDEQIIYDFSDQETPIETVGVLIGTLHYDENDFFGQKTHHRAPIIQWMTKQDFYNQQEVL